MSFQYGQYDEGFSVLSPSPMALRFSELVEHRGTEVTIVSQKHMGYDRYGTPMFMESMSTERAMVELDGGETKVPPGERKEVRARVLLKQWAGVGEDLAEVVIHGDRYHVEYAQPTMAYLLVKARRMIE